MRAMIEYKGYIGVVDFDPEIDLFHRTVINAQGVITLYGASVTELWEEMQNHLRSTSRFVKNKENRYEKVRYAGAREP